MSMLAEPRRKSKYSVDPRGTTWSNDESKLGQKLLEKMGWQKGKGLGANEDGQTEHVKVALKTDAKGVGCSNSYADNWIAQQDDFSDLLASLNQSHGAGGDKSDDVGTPATVSSLEKKSKSSKARVHYQKFTKGKDLSLKTAMDLDCVFGKRKLAPDSSTNTPQSQSETNSDASDTETTNYGVTTVNSSDSIQDYFARKMKERGSNMAKPSPLCVDDVGTMDTETEVESVSFTTAETDNEERVSFTIGAVDDSLLPPTDISTGGIGNEPVKKRRKHDDNANMVDNTSSMVKTENVECSDGKSKKKKNKKKSKRNEVENSRIETKECMSAAVDNNSNVDAEPVNTKSKKHKKYKHFSEGNTIVQVQSDNVHAVYETNLKTIIKGSDCNSTRKVSNVKRVSFLLANEASDEEETPVKKRAKKRKNKEQNDERTCDDSVVEMSEQDSLVKSSAVTVADVETPDIIKKSKVKKSRNSEEDPVTNDNVEQCENIKMECSVDETIQDTVEITATKNTKDMPLKSKKKKNQKSAGLVEGKMKYNFDPTVSPVINKNSDAFTGSNLAKVKGYDGLTDTIVISGLLRQRKEKKGKAKKRKNKETNDERTCDDSVVETSEQDSLVKSSAVTVADVETPDIIKKSKVKKSRNSEEGPVTNDNVEQCEKIKTESAVDETIEDTVGSIAAKKIKDKSLKSKKKKNQKSAGLVEGKMKYNFDPTVSPVVNKNSDAFTGSNLAKVKGYDGLTDTIVISGLLRQRKEKK